MKINYFLAGEIGLSDRSARSSRTNYECDGVIKSSSRNQGSEHHKASISTDGNMKQVNPLVPRAMLFIRFENVHLDD